MNLYTVFEAARELEAGLKQMRSGQTDLGELTIRTAFDKLGATMDPPCGLEIHGNYDYSKLPPDFMEQDRRNGHVPRVPYGVANPVYNLDSGVTMVYSVTLKCSLRHGHCGPCRPSPGAVRKLEAPRKEE